MISAFAKGAQILDEPRYAQAARAAADFLRRHVWDDSRKILLRRHKREIAHHEIGREESVAARTVTL